MITILADHNMEGQAALLMRTLLTEGWADLLDLHVARMADIGLPANSPDRQVWRFAQAHQMLILTANRTMTGPDSLEQTIREEGTPASLPVLTVGDVDSLIASDYRAQCAERIVEILLYLDSYLGAGRLYVP